MKTLNLSYLALIAWSLFTNISCESNGAVKTPNPKVKTDEQKTVATLFDSAEYNKKNLALSNGDTSGKWPAQSPYPLAGAIFPYKRIVAYYGNLYSKKMGILGEFPKDSMFRKLMQEVGRWEKADPSLPVVPALHYIAVTAQTNGGKQRMRMPFHQIDTILKWAKEIDALVFIDIQVGWSTLQEEMPEFEKYLAMPHVHFGIDPEFSMKGGELPGKKIGTFDAVDINYAVDYLSSVVKKYNIPPKILIVHRFTQGMVTNAANIKKTPEVQTVMDMDGWGDKILKRSTWLRYIFKEPVQFTGFKIFYKNDTKKDKDGLYTPEELSKFIPKPVYIQYQ
ncbi:MAG: hypothetical protein ABIQ56_06435 [Chitinophagaceae bacterium]